MELPLAEHQTLLRDSAARLCRDAGADEACNAMIQAGWVGLLVAEDAGGLGLGAFELCLIQREIGRHDIRVPLASVAVAASVVGGSQGCVPCLSGAADNFAGQGALPRADRNGRLHGEHRAVPHAAGADQLLVAADSDDGALLCRVSPDAPGMLRVTRKMIDGCDISDINFTAVAASVVATNAAPLIARMQALLIISVSAELLGLGEAVMDLMLTQLQSREQFGRPIGSFQALQHRAVDAFISLELLRSLAFRVATAFDRGTAHPAMLAALKAKAGRGVLDVVRLALQMHGAMGYTDAHAIGRRTKRALSLSALYGGDAYQYDRFANLSGAVA